MAFCVNCGTKLEEGAKFCTKCGTKIDATAVSEVAQSATPRDVKVQSINQNEPSGLTSQSGSDEVVLLKYTLNSIDFHFLDNNGNAVSATDLFNQKFGAAGVVTALLGVAAGLQATQWFLKAEIYKTKICFTRLNMLGKPTANRVEIRGSEIKSAVKTKTYTIRDKTEITMGTFSQGTFIFGAPAKNRELVIDLLTKMIEQNK